MKRLVFLIAVSLLFASCSKSEFREGKWFAGNKYVEADKLEMGRRAYMENCFACHGVKGDGNGVAAKAMLPPARNFKTGEYKFSLTGDGGLIHDDTLKKIIVEGLPGTAMLPWDIEGERLDALVQYIKTFAPEKWEGKDKELPPKIKLKDDPFGVARKTFAINKGREIYHFTAACTTCHRGYVSKDEYNFLAKKVGEDPVAKLDAEFYQLKPQDSEYGAKVIPPDFTWHDVRDVKDVESAAYRIAAGVYGVMPQWKEVISDEEIWAVAYYVESLRELKEKPARETFMRRLVNK